MITNTLYRKYQQVMNKKRFDTGGGMTTLNSIYGAAGGTSSTANLYGLAGNTAAGLVQDFSTKNAYGYNKGGVTIAKSTLRDAGYGAAVGSVVPVIGTAVGAVAGAVVGATTGIIEAKKEKALSNNAENNQMEQQAIHGKQMSDVVEGQDPGLRLGYQGASYFAKGGIIGRMKMKANGGAIAGEAPGTEANFGSYIPLASLKSEDGVNINITRNPLSEMMMQNGDAKMLSSNNTVIQGPSHADGGVNIPELGTQVEGGETTKDNFVYSKQLGFAKLHLPIARAIGKIEKKPQSSDRVNALKRLKDREDELGQQQESLKSKMGMS